MDRAGGNEAELAAEDTDGPAGGTEAELAVESEVDWLKQKWIEINPSLDMMQPTWW